MYVRTYLDLLPLEMLRTSGLALGLALGLSLWTCILSALAPSMMSGCAGNLADVDGDNNDDVEAWPHCSHHV